MMRSQQQGSQAVDGVTHRFQLFPRALDVLLCLSSIVEVLQEKIAKLG